MRLLVADRVKGPADTFMAPLLPALRAAYDVRFESLPPGDALAQAIAAADIVWLEWCWDHAVWAARTGLLRDKKVVLRLHSIEALGTEFPDRMDWSAVNTVVTVGPDITEIVAERCPGARSKLRMIPNGIDMQRFVPGNADRFSVGWVGHIEPKKNPMLLLQIAHQLHRQDARYRFRVAGAFTDLRTARFLRTALTRMNLPVGTIHFDGHVKSMPEWYADKGILLSTSMYESFGLNIGEAMAAGSFPVIHAFPGADRLWPEECLFTTVEEAVALIRSGRPGLYRDWVGATYGLDRQVGAVLQLLREIQCSADA